MILVTGAAGKTGRSVLKALAHFGVETRTLARNAEEAATIEKDLATEIVIGDLRDGLAMFTATQGVEQVYMICPNVVPDELEIVKRILTAAKQNGVRRIVYHSVLHPQVEAMPHHWQKMRVEEALFASGIDFTILQPCAYMQNILAGWNDIVQNGVYWVPYATSARISMVDLENIGEAAAIVLTETGHEYASYELAGPEALSQEEAATILGRELGREVAAVATDRAVWSEQAKAKNMDEYARTTLLKMFEYYENYDLVGNPRVLESLLGRPATRFSEFISWYSTRYWIIIFTEGNHLKLAF